MIKMIVTDLDETFLKTDKSVSKYTLEIFEAAKNKGIQIVFATARGKSSEKLVPYQLFNGYVLVNGARVYLNGNKIADRTIEPQLMYDFLQKTNQLNIKMVAELNTGNFANYDATKYWNNLEPLTINHFSNLNGNADKIFAFIESSEQIDMINNILPSDLYMNISKDNMGMIMHKNATKKNGLISISKFLNIDREEIVAFGDDINDIEMLEYFGTGVAMENALDEVKNISDYITDTNDNDGVAKWIENNIL